MLTRNATFWAGLTAAVWALAGTLPVCRAAEAELTDASSLVTGKRADDLAAGFRDPPLSARPHVWWHWMGGSASREGITADLEAMKMVGIGGAQVFTLGGGSVYSTRRFQDLVLYAIQEAERLGLEIGIHNSEGWTGTHGPWLKPEHSTPNLTYTEMKVTGPRRLEKAPSSPIRPLDSKPLDY